MNSCTALGGDHNNTRNMGIQLVFFSFYPKNQNTDFAYLNLRVFQYTIGTGRNNITEFLKLLQIEGGI